jgi:hypothetical protein
MHFMQHVCLEARKNVPQALSADEQRLVERTIFATAYAMMQLLDGFHVNRLDDEHTVDYVLSNRIRRRSDHEVLEQFELAPAGDGLCMAIHGWWKGEFWYD